MSIHCEKCGKEIDMVLMREVWDGGDNLFKRPIREGPSNAVFIEASMDWVGRDGVLFDEEGTETIQCPHCGKFPFTDESMQVWTTIQVVCFKKEGGEE